MLTIACVWTGNTYPVEYVERLCNGVRRHLPFAHRFLCYTDHDPSELPAGAGAVPVTLPGWWAKMELFDPRARPADGRTIYFDLDTVILGDLTPLAEWSGDFGICENFTRLAGLKPGQDSRFGSCVMSFPAGWGTDLFENFDCDPEYWMQKYETGGDQKFIESHCVLCRWQPPFLQSVVPPGFFLHWRDFTETPDPRARVAIFAGPRKPDNFGPQWIKDAWI